MITNKDLLNLKGQTAIVTGAVGIGYGIAYRLAEAGVNVVITSLLQEEIDQSVKKIRDFGFEVSGIKCDVANEEEVKKMVEEVISLYKGVDILVNNAGIYPSIPVMEMTLEDFQKVLDVNLKGVFLCSKYVSQEMIKQSKGGKIINITSIDALHPSSVGLAHYDASKHGVWGFTKNIALELAPHNIWVNAVAPGGIITPGVEKLQSGAKTSSVEVEKFLSKIPMKRMGEVDEIGKVVLFLASSMSSYMTGSQIVVDGGTLLS